MRHVIFILSLLMFWAVPTAAQEGQLYPAEPTAQWFTVLSGAGNGGYFDSSDEACRAQHASFNPGAIYLAPLPHPDPEQWYTVNCRWDTSPQGANTVLPVSVNLVCPPDWVRTLTAQCIGRPQGEQDCGNAAIGRKSGGTAGNPICLQSGAKLDAEIDYASADGLLSVERYYNSRGLGAPTTSLQVGIGFGRMWRGLLPGRLLATSSGLQYISDGAGITNFAIVDGGNANSMAYLAEAPSRLTTSFIDTTALTRDQYFAAPENVNSAGEYRLDLPSGDYILFRRGPERAAGTGPARVLVPVEHRLASGYARWFDYNAGSLVPYRIRDSFNRTMTLTWRGVDQVAGMNCTGDGCNPILTSLAPVLTHIALPDGTALSYDYDVARLGNGFNVGANDRLYRVRHLSATGTVLQGRTYLYENAALPYAMTGKLDRDGNRIATYAYDVSGRATLSEHAGGVDRTTVEHRFINNDSLIRIVTNPLGYQSTYRYNNPWWFHFFEQSQPNLLTSVDHAATANVAARTESFAYNSYQEFYYRNTVTDARGVTTNLAYDALGRPLQRWDANGRPEVQNTALTWHPTLDLPLTETRGNLRVEYSYDAQGRLTMRREVDVSTHSLPYATNGQTRSWTYNWAANGRLLSMNGPRAPDAQGRDDTETYTYDAAGNVLTVTNGLGHVTSYANYDANGRPGQMTDANNIVTQFTYDTLGRMLTLSVRAPGTSTAHATTTFEYDREGRVTGITRPATAKLTMTYDLAGRLLSVAAPTGEAISYTYDAMRNVTRTRVTNAGGAQRSQIDRTFDELGRLLTETMGIGRTHRWAYDAEGNPTRYTSARNFATDSAFDGLARLVSAVMPDTGTSANAFNQNDDLTSHSDAVAVTTTMTHNGFGEVIQEVSPDRGTSTYTYNSGGDMLSATDGRGRRVDYTYDILGRVLTRTPNGLTAQRVTYTFDTATIAGSYRIGRLSRIVDGSGSTNFKYDHRGNVLTQAQVIAGSSTMNTTYLYDLADRVTRITYPSGRWVNYARDAQGRVLTVTTRAAGATTTTTLLSAAVYEPFGSLTSATLGNTQRFAQIWDTTGRRTARRWRASNNTTNIWSVGYGYDADDNISTITDVVDASRSLAFQYDSVDRLTRVDMQAGAVRREDYSFDTNGNRLAVARRTNITDANPVSTDSYSRTPGTNRIASMTTPAGTRSFTHDARGNLSGESRPGGVSVTTAYDGYARLVSYSRTNEAPLTMLYNGFDQRVQLTRGSGGTAITRRLVSDRDGRILGEYGGAAGTGGTVLFTEYIWLLPEAMDGEQTFGGDDGTGGWMPLAMVTANGAVGAANETLHYVHSTHLGVPVGTWSIGTTAVPPTATSLPTGTMLIGFPGQLQSLSDLYYNQYRDYDPTTGRYIQADPIGLAGDANPYSYAGANPVNATDAMGLQPRNATRPTIVIRRGPDGRFVPMSSIPSRPPVQYRRGEFFVGTPGFVVSPADLARARNACFGGENFYTAYGRQAHANYEFALGRGYRYNEMLPSGRRPDAVDWNRRIVRELKPDTPRGIRRGERALERYVRELREITGEVWQAALDLYRAPW